MGDIETILNPGTIAVVGASRDKKKVGHIIFKNILESNKEVFPINPKAENILGHRCYNDLLEVPKDIDQIIIAVPAKIVPIVLRQAEKRRVKSAIVLSAGFSEVGNEELEKRIIKIAEETGIKILGPNSYGFINPYQKLNTTYFEGIPKPGSIAFISQSGAIGSAVLDKNLRLSGFVSIGNSAQLDFSDFIEYYSKDKETQVITLYIESLKEGRGKRFMEVCKNCKKPIVVLKAGKSKQGQKAAASHTAALTSEAGVYSGIFRQCKIIEADSIKQMFDIAAIMVKYPGKSFKEVTVITNAGGLGVLTTDYLQKNNIKNSKLSETTISKLNKILPTNWSHRNPIDLIGDALAEDYNNAIQLTKNEKSEINLVLLTPQNMTEPIGTVRAILKSKKPAIACFVGGESIVKAKEFMDQVGIINFDNSKEMCNALGKINRT
jgi:acetate---CoA ligase (ADP-forming)